MQKTEIKKPKIICIGGPTGVGKTALAIKLANLFDGEIISCDSIAIYKHLNIGSAKPDKTEQAVGGMAIRRGQMLDGKERAVGNARAIDEQQQRR